MSAWIIAVRNLSRYTDPVSTMRLGVTSKAIVRARELGMAERVGSCRRLTKWRITDLGRRYLAGEIVFRSAERTKLAVQRAIGDDEIVQLLLDAGYAQGEPMTADVLRAYSAALIRRVAD